jgi:Flp pilus assembly protein TadG
MVATAPSDHDDVRATEPELPPFLPRPRAAVIRGLRTRSRAQSLVEFALILPILLTLTGTAVDISRVYGVWVTLEGATRDAAEQVASDVTVTSQAGAVTRARTILCGQLVYTAGFAAPVGNPAACTSPSLTVTWTSSTVAPGTLRNPLITVKVESHLDFRTLFAYPLFTQNGAWTLGSSQTYAIIQGH